MRVLLLVTTAMALAACAGQRHALTPDAAAGLKGRRVVMSARPPTPVFLTKPGTSTVVPYGATGGVVAGAAYGAGAGLMAAAFMSDAGDKMFRESGSSDPAPVIAVQLSDELRRRYGVTVEPRTVYFNDDDPTRITSAYPDADLVLDVWVDNLNVAPFSQQKSAKYRLTYSAHVRLIDAKIDHPVDGKKGAVIAHATCVRDPRETPDAPTFDELLANQGQRLKQDLAESVRDCVDEFRSTVLPAASPH